MIATFPLSFPQVAFPESFKKIARVFSLVNLDVIQFVSPKCLLGGVADTQFMLLVLAVVGPVLMGVFFCGFMRCARSKVRSGVDKEYIRNKMFSGLLLLSFLVYPSLSARVLHSFPCEAVQIGATLQSYLRADGKTLCGSGTSLADIQDTDQYGVLVSVALVLVVLVIVGVPLWYLVVLLRVRRIVNPAIDTKSHVKSSAVAVAQHEADVIEARRQDRRVQHATFLWGAYKPKYWVRRSASVDLEPIRTANPSGRARCAVHGSG